MTEGTKDPELQKWLNAIGIQRHLKGFRYFSEAVSISLKDNSLLYEITKGMYPKVAERFGTTAECVERSMRHAVMKAWDDENCGMRYVFDSKPTNGALVRYITYSLSGGLADYLK